MDKFEALKVMVATAHSDKIETLLSHAVAMTELDFLDLAIVSLDQAGLGMKDLLRIVAIIAASNITDSRSH